MRTSDAVTRLVDFLLPSACIACGARVPLESGVRLVCTSCRGRLRPPPAPRCRRCDFPLGTGYRPGRPCLDWPDFLRFARCGVALEPPADVIVHALKYEGWQELGWAMARPMARCLHPLRSDLTRAVVVPVPTSRERRRDRGYDQGEVLAVALSERANLPCVRALSRASGGRTQVSLHPQQRLANVKNAFSLGEQALNRLRGADVVLVDDVLTTGATARAAAEELNGAGVRGVTLITYSRALPGGRSAQGPPPASPTRA